MLELLVILALGLGFMWLTTRKSRRMNRDAMDFRANLEVGTEVITRSGCIGTIVAIDDDVVTLESAPGSTTRWVRAAIDKATEPPAAAAADDDDEDDAMDDLADDVEVPDDASSLTRDTGEENGKS